jgi:hypothetical protein
MTDDTPATAQDIIATILNACPSAYSVETIRDMALRSGRYTEQEQALIIQAADTRLVMLRGR